VKIDTSGTFQTEVSVHSDIWSLLIHEVCLSAATVDGTSLSPTLSQRHESETQSRVNTLICAPRPL
jgi:hypothetical protein